MLTYCRSTFTLFGLLLAVGPLHAIAQQTEPEKKPGMMESVTRAGRDLWSNAPSINLPKLPELPDFSNIVAGQFDSVLSELEKAVPVIEDLGYEVTSFRMTWTLPPSVHIRAKSRNIDISSEEEQRILAALKGHNLVYVVAQSLIAAKKVQRSAALKTFSTTVLDISLALPPKIDMTFQDDQHGFDQRRKRHRK